MLRPPRPPSLSARDSALMSYLCELQAFAVQNQLVQGVGYRLKVTPHGTTQLFDLAASGMRNGTGSTAAQMIVKVIKSDWIECLRYNEDTGEDPSPSTATDYIKIALPYRLRKTPFDGMTIDGFTYTYLDPNPYHRRHVTFGVYHEIQVIVPKYRPGDLIYTTNHPLGGTTVLDRITDPLLPQGLTWLDLNVDGRAWAQTFERIAQDAGF